MKCAWASISEQNRVNGKKGDQTGKEVKIGEYYNFNQSVWIRFADKNIKKKIAIAAARIATNNNIGYGQTDRASSYELFNGIKWDINKIKDIGLCNIDCSEMGLCCVNFALGSGELSHLLYSGNLQEGILAMCKRNNLAVTVYKKEPKLEAGDIVIAPGHHVIICIDFVDYSYTNTNNKNEVAKGTPILKKGSQGAEVRKLQSNLNNVMSLNLVLDGDFGSKTETGLKKFQKKYGLAVDGEYGTKSEKKMKELIK